MKLRPIVKYPGGKYYLSKWLLSFVKPHKNWWEGCIGGGSITLNKPLSKNEIATDIDTNLINMYKVIQDKNNIKNLQNTLYNIPYKKEYFDWASDYKLESNNITAAVKYIIRNRFSRDGMMNNFVDSKRLRGGVPENRNSYNTIIDNLLLIHERIKDINFICDSIFNHKEKLYNKDLVAVFDPPYHPDTRPSKKLYKENEWKHQEHIDFLEMVVNKNNNAQIIICGYPYNLYDQYLNQWHRFENPVKINMGNKKQKSNRIEVLWINYLL